MFVNEVTLEQHLMVEAGCQGTHPNSRSPGSREELGLNRATMASDIIDRASVMKLPLYAAKKTHEGSVPRALGCWMTGDGGGCGLRAQGRLPYAFFIWLYLSYIFL